MPPRPLTPSPTMGRASQDSAGSFEAWFEEEDAAAHGAEDDATKQAPLLSSSAPPPHASYEQDAGHLHTVHGQAARGRGSLEEERRVKRVRRIQLGLACMLSVGSHFGSYVLGPVKKALHTSESDFSSLISSFQLVNTITPLVTGLLIPRWGGPKVGLAATGAVLLGQLIVVWAQRGGTDGDGAVGGMIIGLFIFGFGLSPIAVVQESVILQHARTKSVSRSIAIGLLMGKTSAFVAAYCSEPLAAISPRLPFIVAVSLSFGSFLSCCCYAWLDKSLPPTEEDVQEKEEHEHALQLGETKSFGDPFWLYQLVCAGGGIWYTTIHQSSSIIQAMYDETEERAAGPASVILFTSSILYPIVGWLVDARPQILRSLFLAVPALIASTYIIFLFLTSLVPYWLSCLPSAIGIGAAPLLLVIIVPRLVERRQVPTALGLHKSMEMSGAVLCQSIAGWLLSGEAPARERYGSVLRLLLLLILAQFAAIVVWWRLIGRREAEDDRDALEYGLVPAGENEAEGDDGGRVLQVKTTVKGSRSLAETARGAMALRAAAALVVSSWVSFGVGLLR